MKTLVFTFTLLLTTVCNGLAQTNAAVPPTNSALTNLDHLIASADHIIVTNRLTSFRVGPLDRGFSRTISGDQARKIMGAVTNAQVGCSPPCTDSVFDWDLQFYREAHFLAVVHLQESHFVFGDLEYGTEYIDGSGVLEQFYRNL
jgi:hypothetical protein